MHRKQAQLHFGVRLDRLVSSRRAGLGNTTIRPRKHRRRERRRRLAVGQIVTCNRQPLGICADICSVSSAASHLARTRGRERKRKVKPEPIGRLGASPFLVHSPQSPLVLHSDGQEPSPFFHPIPAYRSPIPSFPPHHVRPPRHHPKKFRPEDAERKGRCIPGGNHGWNLRASLLLPAPPPPSLHTSTLGDHRPRLQRPPAEK